MAEKWQQWMPLDVNDWRGSPSVRAMHPSARSGYLDLILAQWDSEDCTVPNNSLELAEISFLGDDLWALHGPRILRKFEDAGNGRLRNPVCFVKWQKAKDVYEHNHEERSKAGKAGNDKRWSGHTKKIANAINPIANATENIANESQNIATYTGTDTNTKEQKQKPSRAPKARAVDERHQVSKTAIRAYWCSKNPDVEMPWDGSEGKALGMFLSASPAITPEKITELLRNRYRSEVNHSDRPSVWLRSLLSYASGPIDRFGKPLSIGGINGKGNGFSNHRSKTAGNFDEARAALSILAGEEPRSPGDSEAGECVEGHFSPVRQ